MPLRIGDFDYNVKELMGTYKRNGKIGNIKPKNKAHALEIALAIAYKKNKNKYC